MRTLASQNNMSIDIIKKRKKKLKNNSTLVVTTPRNSSRDAFLELLFAATVTSSKYKMFVHLFVDIIASSSSGPAA